MYICSSFRDFLLILFHDALFDWNVARVCQEPVGYTAEKMSSLKHIEILLNPVHATHRPTHNSFPSIAGISWSFTFSPQAGCRIVHSPLQSWLSVCSIDGCQNSMWSIFRRIENLKETRLLKLSDVLLVGRKQQVFGRRTCQQLWSSTRWDPKDTVYRRYIVLKDMEYRTFSMFPL